MNFLQRVFHLGGVDETLTPIELIEKAIDEKEEEIEDTQGKLEDLVKDERELNVEVGDENTEIVIWKEKAEINELNGDKEYAKIAYENINHHKDKLTNLEKAYAEKHREVMELKSELMKMNDQLTELHRQKKHEIMMGNIADIKSCISKSQAESAKRYRAGGLIGRIKNKKASAAAKENS